VVVTGDKANAKWQNGCNCTQQLRSYVSNRAGCPLPPVKRSVPNVIAGNMQKLESVGKPMDTFIRNQFGHLGKKMVPKKSKYPKKSRSTRNGLQRLQRLIKFADCCSQIHPVLQNRTVFQRVRRFRTPVRGINLY
jgi:hypothetical protein